MTEHEALLQGLKIAGRAKIVQLGTNDLQGGPQIRAMLHMEHEALRQVWLTTNTSSRKIQQVKADSRACLYYVEPEQFLGLMLEGFIEVRQDRASKERIWRPGFEMYYPLGIDDPDYSVLLFHGHSGTLYSQLACTRFALNP